MQISEFKIKLQSKFQDIHARQCERVGEQKTGDDVIRQGVIFQLLQKADLACVSGFIVKRRRMLLGRLMLVNLRLTDWW